MKRSYIISFVLCMYSAYANAACPVVQLFSPRGQEVDAARTLAGLTNHICIFDMEKFYGTFALTPAYYRSFDSNIPEALFGNSLLTCDCPRIKVSGSNVANRGSQDWLADYFGLAPDFESDLLFNPRISNYLLDFYLYLGLDEWVCGLFAFIHTPVVNTRWDLNFRECNITTGTQGYPIGYFAQEAVPRATLRNNFQEYVNDCNGIDLGNDTLIEPLKFARMSSCSQDDTALADIRFALGWNFFQNEEYHLGLGLIGTAPTGTKPKGDFLFEPLIGNGHHWEFGALVWGHVDFWRSECQEKFLAGWLQANITHMFKAHHYRFFDLKCKPNSKYMLAERMTSDVTLLLANETEGEITGSTVPSNQFTGLYAPIANLTRQEVDVSVGVQADIVVMLNYTSCGFSWDLGYNFWARTCENITPNCSCPPRLLNERWALKGDAYTFGFTDGVIGSLPVDSPIKLSATQSGATIQSGTNATSTTAANTNPIIDNRQWAVAGEAQAATVLLLSAPGGSQTGTSKDPILLTTADIDYDGARTKGITQKVFSHISYSWLDNEDWTPYLGIGAEIEFAQKNQFCDKVTCNTNPCAANCTTDCTPSSSGCFSCTKEDCNSSALSQWGFWIKAGVSFN